MRILLTILRYCLALTIIAGVFLESGRWTGLAVALVFIVLEIMAVSAGLLRSQVDRINRVMLDDWLKLRGKHARGALSEAYQGALRKAINREADKAAGGRSWIRGGKREL